MKGRKLHSLNAVVEETLIDAPKTGENVQSTDFDGVKSNQEVKKDAKSTDSSSVEAKHDMLGDLASPENPSKMLDLLDRITGDMSLEDEISVACHHDDLRQKIAFDELKFESTDFEESRHESQSSDSDTEVEEEKSTENSKPADNLPILDLEDDLQAAGIEEGEQILANFSIPTGTE